MTSDEDREEKRRRVATRLLDNAEKTGDTQAIKSAEAFIVECLTDDASMILLSAVSGAAVNPLYHQKRGAPLGGNAKRDNNQERLAERDAEIRKCAVEVENEYRGKPRSHIIRVVRKRLTDMKRRDDTKDFGENLSDRHLRDIIWPP